MNALARPTRVAVVGVGNVGATFAYVLLLGGLAAEIVLIDANHTRAEGEAMDLQTRDAAYHIIARKGATYYAVAAGLMRIIEAILRDQRTVLSVSSLIKDYYGINDVCLSLPTVVNRSGIERVLRPELSTEEVERLRHSADVLKATIVKLGLD